jgi:ribosome-associated heat shock protein Hsp15
VKSRTGAQRLTVEGKVRVNREKVFEASHLVRQGDVVTVALPGATRVLRVVAPGTRRGPPAEAATLFEDLSPPSVPVAVQTAPALQRDAGSGRPTKRDRRAISALKHASREEISDDEE